jgi:RNA polymerase sigma-70 factor (ECF subfamily)
VTTKVGLGALRSRCRERKFVDRYGDIDQNQHDAPRYEIERQLGARDTIHRLQAALSDMNPKSAEILFLHDVSGLELSEIAVLTGGSTSAVQSRLVRGRRELVARLSDADPNGGST